MKPAWLKIKLPEDNNYKNIKTRLEQVRVNTVCIEAKCPNRIECWSKKAVTFMILGQTCTRNCKFCAVETGNPNGVVDNDETHKIAQAVKDLNLAEVVLTSVTRDDLSDGGASVFAKTITTIRQINTEVKIEVLVPDFNGTEDSIRMVIDAECDVFSHNLETVARLTPMVRDRRASYLISLQVLKTAHKYRPDLLLKSGFMVGLGETQAEVMQTINGLLDAGTQILTIGQYLQPSKYLLPVSEYVTPAVFQSYKEYALKVGFKYVFAGPFVRSSYSRIF